MKNLQDQIQYINQTTRLLLKSGLDTELVLSPDGFGAGWIRRDGGTTDEDRENILSAMKQADSDVKNGIIASEYFLANVPHHLPRKAGGFDADTKGGA